MVEWYHVLLGIYCAISLPAWIYWQTRCERFQNLNNRLIADQNEQDEQTESCNHIHGLLADVCDVAFADENRALQHGYEGVLERVKELARGRRSVSRADIETVRAKVAKYDFSDETSGGKHD